MFIRKKMIERPTCYSRDDDYVRNEDKKTVIFFSYREEWLWRRHINALRLKSYDVICQKYKNCWFIFLYTMYMCKLNWTSSAYSFVRTEIVAGFTEPQLSLSTLLYDTMICINMKKISKWNCCLVCWLTFC